MKKELTKKGKKRVSGGRGQTIANDGVSNLFGCVWKNVPEYTCTKPRGARQRSDICQGCVNRND